MQSTYCTDTLHSQFTHEICQINFSAIVFCAKNLRRKRVTCEICYWGVVKRRNRLRLLLFSVMISHIGSGIKSQWAKRAIVSLFIFVNFNMMLQNTMTLELFAQIFHIQQLATCFVSLQGASFPNFAQISLGRMSTRPFHKNQIF